MPHTGSTAMVGVGGSSLSAMKKNMRLATRAASGHAAAPRPPSGWGGHGRVARVKRSVTVQIAGLRYGLKSDDDDRTIKALAAYVDGKIRDIQKLAKVPDTQAVAVLAALQIAEELFAERQGSAELRKKIREKSQSLLDYLEREARL